MAQLKFNWRGVESLSNLTKLIKYSRFSITACKKQIKEDKKTSRKIEGVTLFILNKTIKYYVKINLKAYYYVRICVISVLAQ